MKSLLQQAIDNLEIEEVFQRSLTAYCADGFDPKYHDFDSIEIQYMHFVRRTEILELDSAEDKKRLFRVIIKLGVRWLVPSNNDTASKKVSNEVDDDSQELAKIEGRLVAEYLLKDETSPEALKIFADQNASYHVWPYWREIVANQCLKMNLPKVTLPAIQFAAHAKEGE